MGAELYRDSAGEPLLRRSVVCFMDLLGMKAAGADADAADTMRRLHGALRRASERYLDDPVFGRELSVAWFTDNVVVAWPWPDESWQSDGEYELGSMLLLVSWWQLTLALDGFWVRGCMALGDVCVTERFAFGQALVDAAEGEPKAVHPRVIVDDEAVLQALQHANSYGGTQHAPQGIALASDESGEVFVNYLSATLEADDEDETFELLERHRDSVRRALETATAPAVRDKLRWLAAYHNHFVVRGWPARPDLVVVSPMLTPQIVPIADLV